MSQMPQRKVSAGGVAGSVSAIVIWLLETYGGIPVPGSIAVAITTLIVFVVQYVIPNPQVAVNETHEVT